MNNIQKAIKYFGSQEKLALACDLSQTAVHKWLHNKARPSGLSAKKIEKATNGHVLKSDLRPDIFE